MCEVLRMEIQDCREDKGASYRVKSISSLEELCTWLSNWCFIELIGSFTEKTYLNFFVEGMEF